MPRSLRLVLFWLAVLLPVLAAGEHQWRVYTNVRFAYRICYPEDLLSPQPEAANSDGRRFLGKDGAQLIVYGSQNATGQSVGARLKETAARLAGSSGKITYQVRRPGWFVISGQNGSSLFYSKTYSAHQQYKSFEITYPAAEAAMYKPVINRLAGCFADLGH